MPRAVAGDDEKEAMRACGAAAIRDCLKRKDSRLIIAKTEDRKVGEFEVLADAKQYKKWISEETGFDFDDKRYPKYLTVRFVFSFVFSVMICFVKLEVTSDDVENPIACI